MKKWTIIGIVAEVLVLFAVFLLFQYNRTLGSVAFALWIILGMGVFGLVISEFDPPTAHLKPKKNEENPFFELVGEIAITISELRPMGTIEIDKCRYEAESLNGIVRPRHKVQVTEIRGRTLVVRKMTEG